MLLHVVYTAVAGELRDKREAKVKGGFDTLFFLFKTCRSQSAATLHQRTKERKKSEQRTI